jgi:hypothetical protein
VDRAVLELYSTRALVGPFLGSLEGTELGFTALSCQWAPLGWRRLHWQTYQDELYSSMLLVVNFGALVCLNFELV